MAMKWASVVGLLLGAGLPARADLYWVSYDGQAFPEYEGWRRNWGDEHGPYGPGADRSVEGRVFVLESLRDDQIYDFYEIQGIHDPQPGEQFIAQWRLLVGAPSDPWDAGVSIARDDPPGYAAFKFAPDRVKVYTDEAELPIEPGVFHEYRFESADMEVFDLYIDGVHVHRGAFETFTLLHSFVHFGDGVQGLRSLSEWDYVAFGVVPEPRSGLLLCLVALTRRTWR
jgi:hypothetical protein